jgi:flagellar biosynthesis protein FlhB
MASARTEPPTPRRLRETRRRGEAARTVDIPAAGALAGGLAAIAIFGGHAVAALSRALRAALGEICTRAEALLLDRGTLGGVPAAGAPGAAAIALDSIRAVLRVTLPIAGAALVGSVVAAGLQAGFAFHLSAVRPRLERLHPVHGLKRLLAPAQLGRAALAVAKGAALLGLAAAWWHGAARTVASLPRLDGAHAAWTAILVVAPLAVHLGGVLAACGLVELALERRRLRRALLMTRDEVRRDLREDEGDPDRRAERQRVHRALVEAGAVARATVVVVNPTHVAVALRHLRGEDGAPRVVAKGTGLAAARIRSAARRAGVPVLRDVPLARALHRLAEVGDEIPEELYDAAAALLAHLYARTENP